MMTPEEFLKSIYLGDRACKALCVDAWSKQVSIRVDLISRVNPDTGAWDHNTAGDIEDGLLVFSGVRRLVLSPPGPLPNDLINDVSVTPIPAPGEGYLFELSIGSVNEIGDTTEVTIRIEASGAHVEDPRRPGIQAWT